MGVCTSSQLLLPLVQLLITTKKKEDDRNKLKTTANTRGCSDFRTIIFLKNDLPSSPSPSLNFTFFFPVLFLSF